MIYVIIVNNDLFIYLFILSMKSFIIFHVDY